VSIDRLHEWMGRFFPHVEYGHSRYVSLLASRRPIGDRWDTVPVFAPTVDGLAEADFAAAWPAFRSRSLDDFTYYLLLLKLSQAFFSRRPMRAAGPLFILGAGPLAGDMAFVLKQAQRTIDVVGIGDALPPSLPAETFVLVMPGAALPAGRSLDHYKVSYRELIGRAVARDVWSTSQDHDTARVRGILEMRARQAGRQSPKPPIASSRPPRPVPPARKSLIRRLMQRVLRRRD
jgi:hypothetical protein